MEFRCRVATATGRSTNRPSSRKAKNDCVTSWKQKGLFVLSIHRGAGASFGGFRLPQRRKIPQKDFILFNQELATLLKAGLPLVQSLDILRKRVKVPLFKSVLDDIYDNLRGGTALSEAFASHGDLFTGVYTASLLAGEKSGSLEAVLRRYVHHTKIAIRN